MHYEIVPIEEKHIPRFRAAVDIVAREKQYLALLYAPPEEKTRQFVLGNIFEGNPHLVVLIGEQLVGWCDVCRNPRHAMMHSGSLGVGLLPEFRGKGIGRVLMTKTIQLAWERGFKRIELTVRNTNANAMKLYQELGFQLEGRHRYTICVDGEYCDTYAMALLHPDIDAPAQSQ